MAESMSFWARSNQLVGQVAIVTGAGSGIGRVTAMMLAEQGATVVLFGRRPNPLEQCAEEIRSSGGAAGVHPLDVANAIAVESAVNSIVERFGRVDILVNNAGINTPRRHLSDTTIEDWQRVIDTNLTGAFYCVRAALPAMRRQGSGLVVNIASGAAIEQSVKSGVAYSAAKRGLVALTHMINGEEWTNGIRATTIYPGEVDTPILELRPVPPPAEVRRTMLRSQDIAAAVVFVALLPPRAVVDDLAIRATAWSVWHTSR